MNGRRKESTKGSGTRVLDNCFEAKGTRIPTDDHFPDENRDIDRDYLLLPEIVIDGFSADSATILCPMFDLVWNASGFDRSFNFDANG